MTDQLIPLLEIPTIDERILSNLDPAYANVLDNLLISLKATTDIYELKKLFDDFSNKYLVLPQLWIYRKNLYSVYVLTTVCANRDEYEELNKKAYCNFYSAGTYVNHKFTKYYWEMSRLVYDREMDLNYRKWGYGIPWINRSEIYNDLSFPHEKTAAVLEFYEMVGDQFLPQKMFLESKKTIKAYEKLKTANYIEDYFEAYTEIGNDTIAIQCIESVIDEHPCYKWLWKSYLHFLKDRQPRVYLEVFQKYVKFFISDTEMLNFFEQEQQRLHSSINMNDHKKLEDFLLSKVEFKSDRLTHWNTQWKNPPRQKLSNSFTSFISQKFSLPSPFIWYMLNHGTAKQVNLLFQACKHLFLLKQTPICCNLIVHNRFKTWSSPFYQQSFRIGNKVPEEMEKIFVANTLGIFCQSNKSLLSTIISKISRCTIWSLIVKGQILSWNELQFLLESGNIKRFVYCNGKITVAGGELVSIENVIEAIPNAHTVILDSAAFTPKTFSRLALQEKPMKFKEFVIKRVTQDFKFSDFSDFIKNHSETASRFTIWFESQTRISFVKNAQNLSKAMLKELKSKKCRPKVSIRIVKKKSD